MATQSSVMRKECSARSGIVLWKPAISETSVLASWVMVMAVLIQRCEENRFRAAALQVWRIDIAGAMRFPTIASVLLKSGLWPPQCWPAC